MTSGRRRSKINKERFGRQGWQTPARHRDSILNPSGSAPARIADVNESYDRVNIPFSGILCEGYGLGLNHENKATETSDSTAPDNNLQFNNLANEPLIKVLRILNTN